jgi:hypothetical protein
VLAEMDRRVAQLEKLLGANTFMVQSPPTFAGLRVWLLT